MDGNFSLAPNIFQQIYVIRVEINNIFIMAIYILLEKKTQIAYEKMLSIIIMEKCEELEMYPVPNIINCDFEKAVINAIKIIFGDDIKIQGCFYHFCQSTQRQAPKLGLETYYREDETFSKFYAMSDGLAFLPVSDIEKGN